jgi:S-methylmethionine-dependent homocysteine/selenocysteine methylase
MHPPLSTLLARTRPVLLDGAMGTELQRRGVNVGLPLWSAHALMEHPDVVLQIHEDYLNAGAQIITTNTFRTTRRVFSQAGLPDRSALLTRQAVELALTARAEHHGRTILIAGSMAPLEDCYHPERVPAADDLRREHEQHALRLANAGVDLLLLETMGTIREARAACIAARQTGLEVVVSFLCTKDGRLYGGESITEAVKAIAPNGPAAFSLNCISPRFIAPALASLQEATHLPVAVYGNVGTPGGEHGASFSVDVTAEEYCEFARQWIDQDVAILGGCCGTTPDYIERLNTSLIRNQRKDE